MISDRLRIRLDSAQLNMKIGCRMKSQMSSKLLFKRLFYLFFLVVVVVVVDDVSFCFCCFLILLLLFFAGLYHSHFNTLLIKEK